MLKLTTTEAREVLSELVNRAAFGNERVILTRHGKDIAALVSIDDLELLKDIRTSPRGRQKALTDEEREETLLRARASMKALQRGAKKRGLDKLEDEDSDREVAAVRKARKAR